MHTNQQRQVCVQCEVLHHMKLHLWAVNLTTNLSVLCWPIHYLTWLQNYFIFIYLITILMTYCLSIKGRTTCYTTAFNWVAIMSAVSTVATATVQFVGANPHFYCPACNNLLLEGFITKCAHHLCYNCCTTTHQPLTCPLHGMPLTTQNIFPDNQLTKQIASSLVYCNYSMDGTCKWTGPYSSLQHHLHYHTGHYLQCPLLRGLLVDADNTNTSCALQILQGRNVKVLTMKDTSASHVCSTHMQRWVCVCVCVCLVVAGEFQQYEKIFIRIVMWLNHTSIAWSWNGIVADLSAWFVTCWMGLVSIFLLFLPGILV